MEREISTLEDALAAIRELSALIHKQAEDILNLKKELAAVRAEIITLKSENAALKKQNAKLEYENAWLKRQIFGSKSERLLPGADQSGLLPGFEETNESEVPAESQTIAEHTRKVRKKNGWEEILVHVSLESKNSLDLNTVRNNVKMVGHRGRWWCFRIAVRSPVSAPARHGRSWYCH